MSSSSQFSQSSSKVRPASFTWFIFKKCSCITKLLSNVNKTYTSYFDALCLMLYKTLVKQLLDISKVYMLQTVPCKPGTSLLCAFQHHALPVVGTFWHASACIGTHALAHGKAT